MSQMTLGIVPAPGLPAKMSENIRDDFEDLLNEKLSGETETEWKVKIQVDWYTGASEKMQEISEQAINIKKENGWDFVISLTDLPILDSNSIILANARAKEKIALISLPAIGLTPTRRKVMDTIYTMIKELYLTTPNEKGVEQSQYIEEKQKKKRLGKLIDVFKLTQVKRKENEQEPNASSLQFILQPKWMGKIKIIGGMTVANRPWLIIPSFKRIMGTAFATGAYMLIFTTLWQLSGLYNWPRFVMLMVFAACGMVVWIIFAHNLWEKRSSYSSQPLRHLYNATTLATLGLSMMFFYIAMFLLFLFAVVIFVPIDLFEEVLSKEINMGDYLRLAWLVSSTSTIAGAIGASLENEDEVRKTAYGYRQYIRSQKIKQQEKQEETEKQEGGHMH